MDVLLVSEFHHTFLTKGNLNISNLELNEIPEEVYSMYDLSTKAVVVDFSSRSSGWYESVDLERFNAAGNEISSIDRLDQLIAEEFAGIKHFDVLQTQKCPAHCRCILINYRPCQVPSNRSPFSEH